MATTSRGGYDHKFIESPPYGLKCLICLAIAREPQQHGECGKLFCLGCITEYRETTNIFPSCPHCRQDLRTFSDGKSAQDVKALKVKCDNLDNGCQWVGELYSFEDHLKKCDHTIMTCPNSCESNQELTKLQRKQLENHITNECPRRQYICLHCQEEGEYEERISIHLDRCPKVQVRCPNEECGERILRCDLEAHQDECEYERTPCKFAKFGCDFETAKRELKEHEEDDQLHLQSTKEKVLELAERLEQQEKKFVTQLKQQEEKMSSMHTKKANRFTTFELTKFRKHKIVARPFHGPMFYSSPKGYRFSVSINANGLDESAGTHVSVYAHLEKGSNDDSLTWPFRGSVTVELLNQLEDKNHKQYTINFPANEEEVSGRVMGGVRGRGWGTTHFIAHKNLGNKPRKNCQYLKDDNLVFRVSVQVPDYKPWLECTI